MSKNLINSIQSGFIAVVILLQLRNALSNCVTTETPRFSVVVPDTQCNNALEAKNERKNNYLQP